MREFFRGVWRIVEEAQEDQLAGEAAKVAYYFFLSIWPLFLGLFALTGILGGEAAFDWIMSWVRRPLSGGARGFLQDYVREITAESRPDMLSIGILLTFWAGSSIFAALGDGLNTMYDLEEARSWWKRRLMALVLLIVASVLLTAGATAILAGQEIIAALGLAGVYNLLRWPGAFLVLAMFLWLVYYWLPDRDQAVAKRYVTIGALVGASLWVLATTLFRVYVANFASFEESYGFVGSILVLLIWLYVTALSILFGGEVAVSLEQGLHRDRATVDGPRSSQHRRT